MADEKKKKIWFSIKILFGIAQIVLGIILILLGVAGLFFPIIPGILFIVLGYFMLRGRKKKRKE